jgi:DNA replication protein
MFAGFVTPSDKTELVSVPAVFFSEVLPEISNLSELKVTLHIFLLLSRKRGYPKGVSYSELRADKQLLHSLKGPGPGANPRPAEEMLAEGLELALARGTLLSFVVRLPAIKQAEAAETAEVDKEVESSAPAEPILVRLEQIKPGSLGLGVEAKRGKRREVCYMVNAPWNREVVQQWKEGEVDLAGIDLGLDTLYRLRTESRRRVRVSVVSPNIFSLYEQNIGVLTPLIAEKLADAEKTYPAEWVSEAFSLAVSNNKRSWRYIEVILKKWASEGRDNGEPKRRSEGHLDAAKYTTGKYAHLFQRGNGEG